MDTPLSEIQQRFGRMGILGELYRPSLALLTDLYELTMACGYWKAGARNREAAFHLLFRESPFRGGFTIACGLDLAIDRLPLLDAATAEGPTPIS